MKVLFVSNDESIFAAGSAARVRMAQYADAVAAASQALGEGHGELHIVALAPKTASDEQKGALYLHPVHAWKLLKIRALAARAHAIILEQGIDVVSAQDPFEQGIAALRAVEGTKAKLHVQVHTDFLSPWFVRTGNWRSPQVPMPVKNWKRRQWADQVLPKAAGIRVVSERIKQSLLTRFGTRISEPVVIPVPVPAQLPPRVPLPHPYKFSFITVGRLEPEKRIEDLLAAMARIVPKYPMVGLFVVGDGRERTRLEKMTKKLLLSDNVTFLSGWRGADEAWGLMESANAYVQASGYEGYGRTLLEAALAKLPIVTTDVGIVGEVFRGYEDVLSVPAADPVNLSIAMVGIVEDMTVRTEICAKAEAAARAHLAAQGNIPARIAVDLASVARTS